MDKTVTSRLRWPVLVGVLMCLTLVLVVTACELVRPVLIGDAIDIYIEGYSEPYCIVENSDLSFQNQFLSREDNCTSYAQMVMVDEQYVYFADLSVEESASLLERQTDRNF